MIYGNQTLSYLAQNLAFKLNASLRAITTIIAQPRTLRF